MARRKVLQCYRARDLMIYTVYGGKCAICGKEVGKSNILHGMEELGSVIYCTNPGGVRIEDDILLCPYHCQQAELGIITAGELEANAKQNWQKWARHRRLYT